MKVIAFSLWGDNPMYTQGAIKNADLAKELYPDWKCWFYIGKSCPDEVIQELSSRDNCTVIRMREEGNWSAMFWRFLPASNPAVEVMISRDADSRLTERERAAVEEWLESPLGFHIMRDHPYHGVPILGGMWGAKRGVLSDMRKLIEDSTQGDYWQVDQEFLRDKVYNRIKDNAMVHDEFFEKKPFPTPRIKREFIGMAYTESDEPLHPEHLALVK